MKLTEEHKKKISIACKGRVFSEEHIQNLRKCRLGKRSGNWKGGKIIINGYLWVRTPGHPYGEKRGKVVESFKGLDKK